jgi:hypothetical protein
VRFVQDRIDMSGFLGAGRAHVRGSDRVERAKAGCSKVFHDFEHRSKGKSRPPGAWGWATDSPAVLSGGIIIAEEFLPQGC